MLQEKYYTYQSKIGLFAKQSILIIANKMDFLGYQLPKRCSLPYTQIFGKLACLVTSKISGINSDDRVWEKFKRVKQGRGLAYQVTTPRSSPLFMTYTVLTNLIHGHSGSQSRRWGKLWDKQKSKAFKVDTHCLAVNVAQQKIMKTLWIFHAWLES